MAHVDSEARSSDQAPERGHDAPNAGGLLFGDDLHRIQLNIALQLLRVSNRVLLVCGAAGIGKSSFLSSLQQRQPAGLHVARITAQPEMRALDLLRALGSGHDPPADPHIGARSTIRPALLVDDADRLTDAVLVELLSLWNRSRSAGQPSFGLLLAGCTAFAARVVATGAMATEQAHSINLRPLTEQQTISHLMLRMRAAGVSATGLLSIAEMRAIHSLARGVPARIDRETRRRLSERLARRLIPQRTVALVIASFVVLAAVLVGALFYADRRQAGPRLAADAPAAALSRTNSTAGTAPVAARAVGPAPTAARSQTAAAPPVSESPVEPPPRSESVAMAPERVAPPAQAEDSASAGIAQRSGGVLDNDWLHARQATHYTIQLVGAANAAALAGYLRRHALEERAALLEVRREGRAWYVVVLGEYVNRLEADAALRQLPRALRRDGAWIRRLDELQRLARD